ncbi:MAG TPA: argininosuccinate lyase [Gammaproteobacteria bacterium]|nr:argininosuccinate lyase [Gammaproteobacteria bacterium]
MARLWDKGKTLDERILAFTAGEDHRLDERLVAYDVKASIAHARMLEKQGLLQPFECAAIADGLKALGEAHASGEWSIDLTDEDVHTALERRLIERIGEPGGRVHLGRSRNDQVLAALRLYMKDAIRGLAGLAADVVASLEAIAAAQGSIPLPGYTHMQPAMPSSVGLWAEGFAAEIADDREGLLAAARRADKSPLGSAAGYGTPKLPIDREATRAALGFAEVHEPVTAVQLSRGKAEASLLFELALTSADLGRLAADLMLFYMQELAFVSLPEEMTTGSSIMPQKRNPDVFELVRAASATVASALAEALALTAKLPSGYHRDLQRLKSPLFRGIDLTMDCLAIMAHALRSVRFDAAKISLDPALFAAEKANELVLKDGIPFREAYRRVAAGFAADAADGADE